MSASAASSIASTRLAIAIAEVEGRNDMFVVKGDDFILPDGRLSVI